MRNANKFQWESKPYEKTIIYIPLIFSFPTNKEERPRTKVVFYHFYGKTVAMDPNRNACAKV